MDNVWTIWGENDETRTNLFAIATSEEQANVLIKELEEYWDETFEFTIKKVKTNCIANNLELYE